jgi:hypothetical protein
MSRLIVLASIIALAAGSANCADDPAHANSIGSIVPSSVMAASSDATLSTLAKGGKPVLGTGDSTIDLLTPDSADGVAYVGQHVTFDVHTTATDFPWVTLDCWVNGVQIYHQSLSWAVGTLYSRTFTLASNGWTSGAADCTATLENWDGISKNGGKIVALASKDFAVQP